ncbi:MAG: YicC family protein [Gammaproteobacteria bacterium]|nr:MAG: YicC family protein [Gammaproteobacteria bacterium]
MVYSMTAFARAEARQDWGELTWEVRSVNHRYLETFFKMPEELRMLEVKCREIAGNKIKRGKLDCNLRFKRLVSEKNALHLDAGLTEQVIHLCRDLDSLTHESTSLNALQILRWPGVVKEPELEMDSVAESVLSLFSQALDALHEMRAGEGARTKAMLTERCDAMRELVARVREHRPKVIEGIREKLNQRLEDLIEKPDMDRLEQELVFQAQKLDVDEELDRLDSHITEVSQVLERNEPVGRRLDFLMQEMNREANTLGSKSADIDTTKASVDLKVLIEQMREQVQNIE